jgi:hypothetical protein
VIDRSAWPGKVTPQHAVWVNRKLSELGEGAAYSEETGKRLAATPRRISTVKSPEQRRREKRERDRRRYARQRREWVPEPRRCRICGKDFLPATYLSAVCDGCKSEIARENSANGLRVKAPAQ